MKLAGAYVNDDTYHRLVALAQVNNRTLAGQCRHIYDRALRGELPLTPVKDETPLIKFFRQSGVPYKLTDILQWPIDNWEDVHDFIQWAFPCSKPSQRQSSAPVLTPAEAKVIHDEFVVEVLCLMHTFIYFLSSTGALASSKENHNYLRVTRCIQSLRETGFHDAADFFYHRVTQLHGPYPNKYWEEAMKAPCLWLVPEVSEKLMDTFAETYTKLAD